MLSNAKAEPAADEEWGLKKGEAHGTMELTLEDAVRSPRERNISLLSKRKHEWKFNVQHSIATQQDVRIRFGGYQPGLGFGKAKLLQIT